MYYLHFQTLCFLPIPSLNISPHKSFQFSLSLFPFYLSISSSSDSLSLFLSLSCTHTYKVNKSIAPNILSTHLPSKSRYLCFFKCGPYTAESFCFIFGLSNQTSTQQFVQQIICEKYPSSLGC